MRAGLVQLRTPARQDAAFTQTGQVSLPNQSGYIHLSTNDRGQIRLITLGRPTITGEMFGLLSTLQSGRGGHLSPVAAPIALIPLHRASGACFGQIAPDEAPHAAYRAQLQRAEQDGFVRLVGMG